MTLLLFWGACASFSLFACHFAWRFPRNQPLKDAAILQELRLGAAMVIQCFKYMY
jgi:hypothetical protein